MATVSQPSTADTAEKVAPVVLQVLPSLVTGGVERGTVDVARATAEAGWTALVASSGGPMVREIQRAGGEHIDMPLDSKNPLVMWRNVSRLTRLIRDRKIDLLHARSRAPAWSARAAARRAGIPFVTTFHGNYNTGNAFKKYYNSVMARGDRVIAISNFIATQVSSRYGADPGKIRIIPRGVDIGLFDPAAVSAQRVINLAEQWRVPDDARVIMLPGRLTRWKGHEVLIEALGRFEDRAGLCCIFVGSDQGRDGYRHELEREISRRGLEPVIRLTGGCNDMPAALMLADVVVSASTDAEAFGRVIVEAQAMGRPVIASDHGAARETIQQGETGWLVPPGDASELAAALREALGIDASTRELLARRTVANVHENYTRDMMCDRTLMVYGELLDARTGNGG